MVELCFRMQEDRPLLGEVLLGERADLSSTLRQRRFDFVLDLEETAVRVPKEDQPHDREEVLVAGEIGVGPQVIRAGPEPFLNLSNMFQRCVPSSSNPQTRCSATG